MKSVNKWIGIGNLTKDPETVFLKDGSQKTTFSIACNESWKDKSGTKREDVEFVNIVCWNKLAEICAEYLNKGNLVYICGKLKTSEWEKDGETKKYTQIVASEMTMLNTKN